MKKDKGRLNANHFRTHKDSSWLRTCFWAVGLKLSDSCRGHTTHSRDHRNNYPRSISCPPYINGEKVGKNFPVFHKDWRYSQTDRTSRGGYLNDSCREQRGAYCFPISQDKKSQNCKSIYEIEKNNLPSA